MEDNRFFIYINLDGFGKYYYEIANRYSSIGTPNINRLINEGIFFSKAYTGIPAITYPMQSAILTGAYSDITENVYKYYDRNLNKLILCRHGNNGETIGEILKKMNIPFVSVQQFALHEKGAEYDDDNFLYIQPGGDYKVRFSEFFKILRGESVLSKKRFISFKTLPQFMFLYIDDLDTIGHNPLFFNGKLKAFTEKKRVKNVVNRLIDIDREIGQLFNELERLKIYESTTILLTSDHGMVPFKGRTSIKKLKAALRAAGFKNIEVLKNEGEGIKNLKDTDVLITGTGIEAALYFRENLNDDRVIEIKNYLLREDYIEHCLTRQELRERGTSCKLGDMIVSPKPPCHFNLGEKRKFTLGGGHDSLNANSQQVFAAIKGPLFRNGYVCEEVVQNIDFIPTIMAMCKLPMSKSVKGRILKDTFSSEIKK